VGRIDICGNDGGGAELGYEPDDILYGKVFSRVYRERFTF